MPRKKNILKTICSKRNNRTKCGNLKNANKESKKIFEFLLESFLIMMTVKSESKKSEFFYKFCDEANHRVIVPGRLRHISENKNYFLRGISKHSLLMVVQKIKNIQQNKTLLMLADFMLTNRIIDVGSGLRQEDVHYVFLKELVDSAKTDIVESSLWRFIYNPNRKNQRLFFEDYFKPKMMIELYRFYSESHQELPIRKCPNCKNVFNANIVRRLTGVCSNRCEVAYSRKRIK